MAAHPKRKNARKARNGVSQWMIFGAGILFGLTMAFLLEAVFHDDEKDEKTPVAANNTPPGQIADSGRITDSDHDIMPDFDFYSVLPELEVVIAQELTDTLNQALPAVAPSATQPAPQTGTVEATPASCEPYFIQAGSYKRKEDAERMKVKLLLLGLNVKTKAVNVKGEQYHRVSIGPLVDDGALETARDRLKKNNIQYIVLKSRAH